jgi:ribosome biogenesis GTPase
MIITKRELAGRVKYIGRTKLKAETIFLNDTTILEKYGWNEHFAESFAEYAERGFMAGRVYTEDRRSFWLYTNDGEVRAQVSGKFAFQSASRADLPAVGDWVVFKTKTGEAKAFIHAVLPRSSKFSRKAAGTAHEEQVVGTNIDTVFLVSGLDNDFNLRRIERYLVMVAASGSEAVVVLNKADLCVDLDSKIEEVTRIAPQVPIVAASARDGKDLDLLQAYAATGKTVALIGSSGVGKSTIVNHLLGYGRQSVQEVRAGDDRGMHTTTKRELMMLPNGGLIIDTPGMRELQLWINAEGLEKSFEDIADLSARCFYRNCDHDGTRDCAVKEALVSGELDTARWESFKKLQNELALMTKDHRKTSGNKR